MCQLRATPGIATIREPDADPSRIPETVIQGTWARQEFDPTDLRTTEGLSVAIREPGIRNSEQGPDFLAGRVTIDGVEWAGSIEIHRRSGDWYRHGHDQDAAYNSVILHVTLLEDNKTGKLERMDGTVIPEIVLLPRLSRSLRQLSWIESTTAHRSFPCETGWPTVRTTIVEPFLWNLAARRIESKARRIGSQADACGSLSQAVYEEVMRSLGYSANAEAMVVLARRVPVDVLGLIQDSFDAECLLLGASGLLPEPPDFVSGVRSAVEYAMRVASRFNELNSDYRLRALPRRTWRLGRVRPGNHPLLRIAQAAALFSRSGPIIDPVAFIGGALTTESPLLEIDRGLRVGPGVYWEDHATLLTRRSRRLAACMGKDRRTTIMCNAIIPATLLQPLAQSNNRPIERALGLLAQLDAQPDSVTTPYLSHVRASSSVTTQGLHELSRNWCRSGRCPECPIGRHLIGNGYSFRV